jgi:molecular chaperone DnaK (HSP70)
VTPPEQLVLNSLIEKLKNKTEDYLGKAIGNATLTFPDFFNSTQKLLLHNVLEEASIQSVSCPHAEDSTNAAALAIRHARYH